MRLLVIINRFPRLTYGEDRLLLHLARLLSKKHEVYMHVLSCNKTLRVDRTSLQEINQESLTVLMRESDLIILHHDTSIVSIVFRKLFYRVKAPILALVFFIDTYNPLTMLRCWLGWFLAQVYAYIATFSEFVYKKLRSLGIFKLIFLPLVGTYVPCACQSAHQVTCEEKNTSRATPVLLKPIRIGYIGVVDDERFNLRIVLQLAFNIHKTLKKNVELVIVQRSNTSSRATEKSKLIGQWLRVKLINKYLSLEEKCKFFKYIDVFVFTAKRVRFVIPPIAVLEALWHNAIVYAPYLGEFLKKELRAGVWKAKRGNVYVAVDEILHRLFEESTRYFRIAELESSSRK